MKPGGNRSSDDRRTHVHQWGYWRRSRTQWASCSVCDAVGQREGRNFGESSGPDARQPLRPVIAESRSAAARRMRADWESQLKVAASPGRWIQWATGLENSSSTINYLHAIGYEARSELMPDGTFTVWSQRLPSDEDPPG